MFKGNVARWQANFFTGLAVILPIVITLTLVVWLFGTVSSLTDTLLFFLPRSLTHEAGGSGDIKWNWSLLALLVGFLTVSLVGRLTRYYIGRKLFQLVDHILLSIPMLNKIYSTIKQVNDAFSSSKKSSFQQVVLVEFPREGLHSVGFITGENQRDIQESTGQETISVFVPTTPNPTTGFLVLVPANKVVRLDIPVSEGIKFLISLGSVPPEHAKAVPPPPPAEDPVSGATEFITVAVQRAGAASPSAEEGSPAAPLKKPTEPAESPPRGKRG